MKNVYLNNIIRVVLLIIAQLFIFNNIHLAGYAIPIIYGYAILKLPFEMSRMLVLFLSFLIGGLIDVFMGTYGVNAAAATFVGFLRPYVANAVFKEMDEGREATPSIREFGASSFFGYLSILTIVHVTTILMIETFTLSGILNTFFRILSSAVLSIVFMGLIELIFQPASAKRKKY